MSAASPSGCPVEGGGGSCLTGPGNFRFPAPGRDAILGAVLSTTLAAWLLLLLGAALALAGALWGRHRATRARSLLTARVTRRAPDGMILVSPTVPGAVGATEAPLERAVAGLLDGDTLQVLPRRDGVTYRPDARPWEADWLAMLGYGPVLLVVGAVTLATGADHEVPFVFPLLGVVFLALPFAAASRVAARIAFARHGRRVTGRIVGYRNHPHIRMNQMRASMAQVEYALDDGAPRRGWSRAAYVSSLFTGRPTTVWVSDRNPADVMTVGAMLPVFCGMSLLFGAIGAALLLGPLVLL